MARAHRLATIVALLTSLYALLFFAILPVPFVDEDVVVKILPTVRHCCVSLSVFRVLGACTDRRVFGGDGQETSHKGAVERAQRGTYIYSDSRRSEPMLIQTG